MGQLVIDVKCPRCQGLVSYKDVKDVVDNVNRRTFYCEDNGRRCGMIGLFISKTRDEAEDLLQHSILENITKYMAKHVLEQLPEEPNDVFINRLIAAQTQE